MKILYGVVGEGMGHAVRSCVTLEMLTGEGHELFVVVSGRAHEFLKKRFAGKTNVRVEEIHGLSLVSRNNKVKRSASLRKNVAEAPRGLKKNFEAYRTFVEARFRPEAVISDFESWSYFYGRLHNIPVISIDNMQIINRCRHTRDILRGMPVDYRIAKMAVDMKLKGAYHYLITSFFFPPVKKSRTTLVSPILRSEILQARREAGKHVLVYQTASTNTQLIPKLLELPLEFRIYGMGKTGVQENLTFCPFSETQFLEDLRTAKAVFASAGFSLMAEAVHLHVPMLALPLRKQFEQELNARYLEKLGYGKKASVFSGRAVSEFMTHLEDCQHAVDTYQSEDNQRFFACLNELLWNIRQGNKAPRILQAGAV